jgi:hypothetical protein
MEDQQIKNINQCFLAPIYSRITHADASASWYTPQSGVNVHQLILAEATTVPKDMIWATLEGGTAGKVDGFNCLPARPIKTGKAITFGIQTKFSNLVKKIETFLDYGRNEEIKYVPVYKPVSAKGNLLKNNKSKISVSKNLFK